MMNLNSLARRRKPIARQSPKKPVGSIPFMVMTVWQSDVLLSEAGVRKTMAEISRSKWERTAFAKAVFHPIAKKEETSRFA